MTSVAAYSRLRYRIRAFGRLRERRGATLVIANAQTEADDTAVVPLLSCDALLEPVDTASSRRCFEPGFMAVRIPWLARALYSTDFSPLFRALAINPIENELYARPLRSIAAALRASDAGTPLRAILDERACERLGIGEATLASVFTWERFRAGSEHVRLREVREPFRSRILAATRRQHAEDVARLSGILERGGTVYLVPEGRFQEGGCIGAFGGVIARLAPLAEVLTCGISYDPFRSGRPSFLYRLVPAFDPEDLPNSLRVARPVTISQVLAHLLEGRSGTLARRDLAAGVAETLASLPQAVFRDPEIAREGTLTDALAALARLGIVTNEGDRLRIDDRIGARDRVREQAASFRETLEAARTLQPDLEPAYSSPS